jgi:hypothetical protein
MIFQANGRWRGTMPFRTGRKPLSLQRRTGEPSPSFYLTKSAGSYTQKMRESFFEWCREHNVGYANPLNFEYRLSRHKIVRVTGIPTYLKHDRDSGGGSKGFILYMRVIAIDGVRPDRTAQYIMQLTGFAWNRIVASESFKQTLALGSGKL